MSELIADDDTEESRKNSLKDYLILIGAGTVALVAVIFAIGSGALDNASLRKTGEPHWSDRYVRAAVLVWWVLALAAFGFVVWQESLKK